MRQQHIGRSQRYLARGVFQIGSIPNRRFGSFVDRSFVDRLGWHFGPPENKSARFVHETPTKLLLL